VTAREYKNENEDFAHLVFRVYGAFHGSLFRSVSPEPGLGRPGLEILGFLHAAGPSTSTAAAQACRMATSQLSLTVERLVEKGFVERDREGADRRVALISITKKGEKAFARAYEGVRSRVEAYFAPLSAADMKTVREAFDIVAGLATASEEAESLPSAATKERNPR